MPFDCGGTRVAGRDTLMAYQPPPKFYPPIELDQVTGKYELTQPWHIWFLDLGRNLGIEVSDTALLEARLAIAEGDINGLQAAVAALIEGHSIEDEGTPVTQRAVLNFTGAGVSVSDVGGKTTVNIPSGGGATWTEIEVDFGTLPVYSAEFTITDAAITSSAVKMQVLPCGKAATGRTADDWAWDGATFAANPGTGSATCYAYFLPGPVVGPRKIQYSVGA